MPPEVNINVGAISSGARTGFQFEAPGIYAGSADGRTDHIGVMAVDGYNDSDAEIVFEANGQQTRVRARQPFHFQPGGRIRVLFLTPSAALSANDLSLIAKGDLLVTSTPRGARGAFA